MIERSRRLRGQGIAKRDINTELELDVGLNRTVDIHSIFVVVVFCSLSVEILLMFQTCFSLTRISP